VWPYNVRRFYNTCNVTVDIFAVAENGLNTYGAVRPGNFVVISDESYLGAPIPATVSFACTYPQRPTGVGGRGSPSYGGSHECH
jgi:hypothetical protein